MNHTMLKKISQIMPLPGPMALSTTRAIMVELEKENLNRFGSFLESNPNCFDRSNTIGHITGSALIVSPSLDKILLMHHKKLNKWLQMGDTLIPIRFPMKPQ